MRGNGQYLDLGNKSTDFDIDASKANVQAVTLTGNVRVALRNFVDGEPFVFIVTQDGTGSRVMTFDGAAGATLVNTPTINPAAGATTTLTLFGIDAQDQVTKTVACVGQVNGGFGGSGWYPSGGYLTASNNASGTPSGISLDALVGDTLRLRVNEVTLVELTGSATRLLGPDGNAEMVLNAANGLTYVAANALNHRFFSGGVIKMTVANGGVDLCGADASDVGICAGGGSVSIAAAGGRVGFYGAAVTPKQTGVAVTAAAIHAALVTLGLIGP